MQNKPKETGGKNMIEIRAEANEIENKHIIQSIYEAKDWFFKKKS